MKDLYPGMSLPELCAALLVMGAYDQWLIGESMNGLG